MSNMFKPRPTPAPPTPAPQPVAPMPDAEAPAGIEARRKAQAELARRGGRASTILTAPENRGGVREPYIGRQLG